MKRIIDISNFEGAIWVEDEGWSRSDFTIEKTYLFSLSLDLRTNNIEVFHKPYFRAANPFKGTLRISLGKKDPIEEGDWNQDYNEHIKRNIIIDNFFSDYVRQDYDGTITVDMEKETATYRDEKIHFDFIIKDKAQQARWDSYDFSMRSI